MDSLTDDEVKELFRQYRASGSTAIRNRIVEDMMPKLERYVATLQVRRFRRIDLDDAMQEAWMIVMEAIETFDHEVEGSFQWYACASITRKINHIVSANAEHFTISIQGVRRLGCYRAVRRRLMASDRPHDFDDVYRELGWKSGKIKERFRDLLRLVEAKRSGSTPADPYGHDAINDLPSRPDIEESREGNRDKAKVVLSLLTESQTEIVRKRFGIGCEPLSLKNIARARNLAYETVRRPFRFAMCELEAKGRELFSLPVPVRPRNVLPPPVKRTPYQRKTTMHLMRPAALDAIKAMAAEGVPISCRTVANRAKVGRTTAMRVLRQYRQSVA